MYEVDLYGILGATEEARESDTFDFIVCCGYANITLSFHDADDSVEETDRMEEILADLKAGVEVSVLCDIEYEYDGGSYANIVDETHYDDEEFIINEATNIVVRKVKE